MRERIESALGETRAIEPGAVSPTSQVKRAIALAFDEARKRGSHMLGTQHLLLGLLIEGKGVAAHVLNDLGVNEQRVRDAG